MGSLALVLLLSVACGSNVPVDEDTDGNSGSGGPSTSMGTDPLDPDGSGTDSGVGPDGDALQISVNRDADILFVVDNSASMAGVQANLASGIGSFVDALGDANYRIGITTTDMGNYWCSGSRSPAPTSGRFVLSSCQERLGDFTFIDDDASGTCLDTCALQALELEPTATADDPNPAPRPWIESTGGVLNLPEGVDLTTALQCALPQGINGCGFESHLESMRTALRRTAADDEDAFGFLRDAAVFSVVFVTDEADCSFHPDQETIVFGEEGVGNQVFWSLPDQQVAPSSAVCWNAGVDCDFDLDSEQCVPADKDVDGDPLDEAQAADQAALYPVERYRAFLQELEDGKQLLNPAQDVLVAGIVGVPENYPQVLQMSYAPGPGGDDPSSFQAQFGIGPGCASQVAEAVPPVRLRAFADGFLTNEDDGNLFSACSNDYRPALDAIGNAIQDQLTPACMPACVADTDPVQTGLQPLCTVEQRYIGPDGSLVEDVLVECADGLAPPGAEVCFRMLTDPAQMSTRCVDDGWNLEFDVIRIPGSPAPAGVAVSAQCELSSNVGVDCPGLPG